MPGYLKQHRIRVRNKADTADLLVVSDVRGDTLPYLTDAPTGDGSRFNPLTSESFAGTYVGRVADAITTGTSRVVTSLLEDGSQRPQLGFHKTYIETSLDGGGWASMAVGFLTLLRLVENEEYELHVQDASLIKGGVELFNAIATTTVSSFLSTWPNRGCLYGGPIMGSFLNMQDWGGWQMRVHVITALGHERYWLEPLAVYGPGAWRVGAPLDDFAATINEEVRKLPKGIPEFQTIPLSTVGDWYARGHWWPGLMMLVNGVPFRPIPPAVAGLRYGGNAAPAFDDIISPESRQPGVFAYLDGQTALTEGQVVRVRCLTVLPSEVSPIYVDAHPMDHFSTIHSLAGVAIDATATAALKNTIGAGFRYSERITGTKKMGEFLRSAVYRPFQVGTRVNSSGEVTPFSTSIFANTPPTRTITDALVVDSMTRIPFEIDATAGLQRVTLRQKLFRLMSGTPDGVQESGSEITILNGDSSTLPSGTLDIDVPGMIRSDPAQTAAVGVGWLQGIAAVLFDRFGRGNQGLETAFVRGDGTTDADLVSLGDEVLVNIKQLPNHNKRLGDDGTVGARAMQIVQLTERVAHRLARLADSGPNAQPISTKPTHTIAQNADSPSTIAELTITNAAALNALGYAVRVQVAVTTGGAPAAGDYSDVYTSQQGAIPTTAIRLPAAMVGTTVYARARSEKTGLRPSDWQTGVSVALSTLDAPTSLGATAVATDGSQEDLAWATGTNAGNALVDVWVRAQGSAFSTAVLVQTLPPGSTQYRVEQLTPNTAYTASVRHRDADSQDVSARTDVNFTTANVTVTLAAPTSPRGFSGGDSVFGQPRRPLFDLPFRHARYGIAVVATEFPSQVEVYEALETAAGSGSFGTSVSVGVVSSVSNDWTIWQAFGSNDGRKRRLKARHVRTGATPSSFTSEVDVTPWNVQTLAGFAVPSDLATLDDRYVNVTGDAMTGTLDMATSSTARIILPVGTDKWAT